MNAFRWAWPGLSSKEKAFVLGVWLLAILVLSVLLVYVPFKNISAEVESNGRLSAQQADLRNLYAQAVADVGALKSRRDVLLHSRPGSASGDEAAHPFLYAYLTDWVRLAEADHIRIISLKVENSKPASISGTAAGTPGGALDSLPVKVIFEGEYTGILHFLAELEGKSRLSGVEHFSLGLGDNYPELKGEIYMNIAVTM